VVHYLRPFLFKETGKFGIKDVNFMEFCIRINVLDKPGSQIIRYNHPMTALDQSVYYM